MKQEKSDIIAGGILISIAILGLVMLFSALLYKFKITDIIICLGFILAGNFVILVFVILVIILIIGILLLKNKE